jgi:hypothetical protein
MTLTRIALAALLWLLAGFTLGSCSPAFDEKITRKALYCYVFFSHAQSAGYEGKIPYTQAEIIHQMEIIADFFARDAAAQNALSASEQDMLRRALELEKGMAESFAAHAASYGWNQEHISKINECIRFAASL